MPKYLIVVLALITSLIPLMGFPYAWKTPFIVFFSLAIALAGYYRERPPRKRPFARPATKRPRKEASLQYESTELSGEAGRETPSSYAEESLQ